MAALPSNPLSLAVPAPAFERWFNDCGYLQLLDLQTSAAPSSAAVPPPTDAAAATSASAGAVSIARAVAAAVSCNAFAKLSAEDFSGPTPRWTTDFVGAGGAYGWPTGTAHARLRVQENVRRFARNYATVAALAFACCLYRMPVALLGILLCLAVWEAVRHCNDRWALEDKFPAAREILIRIAQISTAVILYFCNLQFTVVCAIAISYTTMILHATFRRLTPLSQRISHQRQQFFK